VQDPTRNNYWRASIKALRRVAAFAVAAFIISACGGDGGNQAAAGSDDTGQTAGQQAAEPTTGGFPSAPDGAIDQTLAAQGAEMFKSRGCVACHTFGGGRLVGPDLIGVTERRSFEWTYAMITNPDSMLANDKTARALLAEYYTPMTNQNVQRDEALALYEHIRDQNDGGDAVGD